MTFFIFAGDMLVMFFMISLVVWLGFKTSDARTRRTAEIPLRDEDFDQKND